MYRLENKAAFDYHMMGIAIEQAKTAAFLGEVPVGAVVCREEEIVALAFNRREIDKNALAHAELLAINKACNKLGGWRLHMCDLYVTLEPCPMCAGAIINSRIRRVIFGASDSKAGCFGSLVHFEEIPFNHQPEITAGVRTEECSELLTNFFYKIRSRKNL